jgi:hypothetical protein
MVAMLVNVSCYGCHVMCAIDENIGDECFVSQNTYTLQNYKFIYFLIVSRILLDRSRVI